MSYLRLLCASAAIAIAFVLVGPFLWGSAPALAAGPNSGWHHDQHMHMGAGMDNDHQVRTDRDDHNRFRFPQQNVFFSPAVTYVQPVSYAVYPSTYAPVYTTSYVPAYSWESYGPGWDTGLSLGQIEQVCAQYNAGVAAGAPGNPYVQGVCGGSGVQVYVTTAGYYP